MAEHSMTFKLEAEMGNLTGVTQAAQKEFASIKQEFDALNQTRMDISSYQEAQKAVAAARKEAAAFGETQNDIAKYGKAADAVEEAKDKLERLKRQLASVRREMENGEGANEKYIQKEAQLEQKVSDAKRSIEQKTATLDKYGNRLKDAEVNTDDLDGATRQLNSQIDSSMQKEAQAAEEAARLGSALEGS